MNLHPDHQRRLFEIAGELATELRCVLLDTEGDGPQTQHTRHLVERYERLMNTINDRLAKCIDQMGATQ